MLYAAERERERMKKYIYFLIRGDVYFLALVELTKAIISYWKLLASRFLGGISVLNSGITSLMEKETPKKKRSMQDLQNMTKDDSESGT